MIIGWYYLHSNGDLIYKRDLEGTVADLRESDFVKALWPFDPDDRAQAWNILIEALAAGANLRRIKELAEYWGCNNDDALNYAHYLHIKLCMDGKSYCAKQPNFIDLQASKAGFGASYLEALADLATNMDYKSSKMWGNTFKQICDKEFI